MTGVQTCALPIWADQELSIVEKSRYFVLTPTKGNPGSVPIIFYPGGLVAPQSYLYKMGKISLLLDAEVYIIKAPFNASIFMFMRQKGLWKDMAWSKPG